MEQAVVPARHGPLRSIVKAVLHIIIKTIILTMRAIKRYPVPATILLVILAGSYFAVDTGAVVLPSTAASTASNGNGPSATEQYLRGQQEYNAERMWEGISDDMKRSMSSRGQTLEGTQEQLELTKIQGITYDGYEYVIGKAITGGGSVHLYIVSITNSGEHQQIPYTFTLDARGKIARVD